MEDINSPVFAQAKIEYTKQLIDVLKLPIYEGLQSIYSDCKRIYADTDDELPNIFRRQIENVPKWNVDMIENEVDRIIRVSNCDWLEDLITAVFISHTKILASLGNNSKRVNLTIPKSSNFIHKCYINSAREMWKNPYLFDENVSSSEYQKNIKYIEDLIEESIHYTIRKALPVKEILRDHFEHSEIGEKNKLEIDKTKNLQKILMKEIMETRKEKEDFINKIDDLNNPTDKYFDDHVDEKMIQENTTNLEINDILSDNEDEVVEQTYENPDIIETKNKDEEIPITVEEKLNGYKNIIEENKQNVIVTDDRTEDIIVKKLDDIVPDIVPDIVVKDDIVPAIIPDNGIIKDDIKNIVAIEQINNILSDESKEDIKTVGLGKVEEVITDPAITDDKDETMTIDNFMSDVNNLLNDKDDFTLFKDAKEIET